jgi:hypothetical protein
MNRRARSAQISDARSSQFPIDVTAHDLRRAFDFCGDFNLPFISKPLHVAQQSGQRSFEAVCEIGRAILCSFCCIGLSIKKRIDLFDQGQNLIRHFSRQPRLVAAPDRNYSSPDRSKGPQSNCHLRPASCDQHCGQKKQRPEQIADEAGSQDIYLAVVDCSYDPHELFAPIRPINEPALMSEQHGSARACNFMRVDGASGRLVSWKLEAYIP